MVRHLISVHRSSWLDWKYDQNWTEPNCKGLDHQLWLPWSWIFLVASPKVWQKKERPVWTSCNWSFHSIYQLAPTTTNKSNNNKQLWQPLFLHHTHQSRHLATTAITTIWPPPPAIIVDNPQPHQHTLTQQKQHADTMSASEWGQWGPCNMTMTMGHRLTVTTHGIITVNISLWLCQLRWVSTTLSPHSSCCWQWIQVPHRWQQCGNQMTNDDWFVIHHCHQLTMAWWQQHNNNTNGHATTSAAAASQWPAPPPLPSPPALELHGMHTTHPTLLPLQMTTPHNNGGMSHNMETTHDNRTTDMERDVPKWQLASFGPQVCS